MGDFDDKVKRIEEARSTGGLAGWWRRMGEEAETRREDRNAKIASSDIQYRKLVEICQRLKPAIESANNSAHGLWGNFSIINAYIERKKPEHPPILVLPFGGGIKHLRKAIVTTADESDKYSMGTQSWSDEPTHFSDLPKGWYSLPRTFKDFTADQVVQAAETQLAQEFVYQKSRTPWRVAAVAGALAVSFGLLKSCDGHAHTVDPADHDADRPVLVDPQTLDH